MKDKNKQEEKPYNGNEKTLNRFSKQGKRIRIQFDIDYPGDPGKTPEGTSQTVPDMNLTVRQLLENHTRGRNSQVTVQQPLYFETELPTITDITDVAKYKEHLQHRMDEVNKFLKKEHEDAKEKEAAKNETKKQNKTDSEQLDLEKEASKASK